MKKFYWVGIALLVALFPACQKTPVKRDSLKNITNKEDKYQVPPSVALQFAKHMTNKVFFETANAASKPTGADSNLVHLRDDVTDYDTVCDNNGETALYIINYGTDSGYIVLSADYRYEPVCAYADHGHINFNTKDTIPSMLGSWFGHTVENIEDVRNGSYDNGAAAGLEWERWAQTMSLPISHFSDHIFPQAPNPCVIPITPVVVQPLLQTEWGQGCGFNNLCPNLSCNLCNPYAKAGCVAVAMAQVIRYWQYPGGYSYSSMPDFTGNYAVQKLIADAGGSVNTDYGCSESGADGGFWNWLTGNSVIPGALKNYFDYSTATYDNHFSSSDKWIITNDLDNGKPVLLGGYTDYGSFMHLFYWGKGTGHEWVCDGYKLNGTQCYKHLWFHMNWGWNGYDDIWYYWDNWHPSGLVYNFQYCKSFVHNINP